MSQSTQVNYDAIAPNYDQRTEGGYLEDVATALQKLARQIKARRILDLGCGTGRSLRGLTDSLRPNPICYGLDFSGGMLNQARRFDPSYRLVNASAPSPPFASTSFDLIICVLALHHFPHKLQTIQNAYRMLRPGGVLAIVNFNPHEGRDIWYIYDYFEGVYETDLKRFPSLAEQKAMLNQVGFQSVDSSVVELITEKFVGEAVFDNNYFLQKGSSSQLILLSEEAYQAGLARMRNAITEAKAIDEEIVFALEIKNWLCYGFKPS